MAVALYRCDEGGREGYAGDMMVIFATCPDDDEGVSLARAWIRAHGITKDEAKLVKRDGCVCVVDKAETWRRIKPSLGVV